MSCNAYRIGIIGQESSHNRSQDRDRGEKLKHVDGDKISQRNHTAQKPGSGSARVELIDQFFDALDYAII